MGYPRRVDRASVDQLLRTTRSVRRRLDFERPIEPGVIEDCIDLAVQAPTGGNREAWRFLVLCEAEPKRAVAECYRRAFDAYRGRATRPPRPAYRALADRLHEFPALILVCMEGRPADDADNARNVAFYGSVLPAAWSLMLALRSRGLGSTWTTLHLLHEREVACALGIPEDVTQTVLLPVGYLKDAVLRPAARKPADHVTYWNAWGRRF
jgi:nitroreductase